VAAVGGDAHLVAQACDAARLHAVQREPLDGDHGVVLAAIRVAEATDAAQVTAAFFADVRREQQVTGQSDIIGVDTLILGSVTEFGRSTVGQSGFLSSTKRQVAHAKVEIRFADPRTGQLFFSAAGTGEATSEAGEIAGFGSRADYDGSLNDKAIGAAVSDVLNSLVAKLQERPWHTDILKIQGNQVFISGGARQGIKVGDTLAVMRPGETIKSNQTGFAIPLPPSEVGTIRVTALFGSSDADEGSIAELVSGSLGSGRYQDLIVAEKKDARS